MSVAGLRRAQACGCAQERHQCRPPNFVSISSIITVDVVIMVGGDQGDKQEFAHAVIIGPSTRAVAAASAGFDDVGTGYR